MTAPLRTASEMRSLKMQIAILQKWQERADEVWPPGSPDPDPAVMARLAVEVFLQVPPAVLQEEEQ